MNCDSDTALILTTNLIDPNRSTVILDDREGHGVYRFDTNDEVYKGEFKNNSAEGYGEQTFFVGDQGGERKFDTFCGRFQGEGLRYEGTETWADGSTGWLVSYLTTPLLDVYFLQFVFWALVLVFNINLFFEDYCLLVTLSLSRYISYFHFSSLL